MTKNKSEWYVDWFKSPFYHQLYKERDYSEATFFMNNLIKHLDIRKESNVLDLACGRGRYSQYLSTLGYKVTGIVPTGEGGKKDSHVSGCAEKGKKVSNNCQ